MTPFVCGSIGLTSLTVTSYLSSFLMLIAALQFSGVEESTSVLSFGVRMKDEVGRIAWSAFLMSLGLAFAMFTFVDEMIT